MEGDMIYNEAQKVIANKIEITTKLSNWRDRKWQLKYSIRSLEVSQNSSSKTRKPDSKFTIRQLTEKDAEPIIKSYEEKFVCYPFPIYDSSYIIDTMRDNVQYFGVEEDGKLAAVSSAEIDFKGANAEVTDFATPMDYQVNGLVSFLLAEMEETMKKLGITTLYIIARLKSPAMTKTFFKADYTFTGTLVNNTNIAGTLESMNVYYKHISNDSNKVL